MGARNSRRLIVNADDFGRSSSINRAVLQAHREGILTTASLMVNGEAVDEAVQMARDNPTLGVGLHLSLICGKAALSSDVVPDLANQRGEFSNDPVASGFRYFVRPAAKRQIALELAAQFDRFAATGLPLDHVNGHLHFHLHPTVFDALLPLIDQHKVKSVRLTREPFFLNAKIASGRWPYRVSHAVIFRMLSNQALTALRLRGVTFTENVFGLLQNGLVDEAYLLKLIPELPEGNSELYSHPSLDEFKNEFDALISPRVRAALKQNRIDLIRYSDL